MPEIDEFHELFAKLADATKAEEAAKALTAKAQADLLAWAQKAAEAVLTVARSEPWMAYIPRRIVVTHVKDTFQVEFFDLHDRHGLTVESRSFYFDPSGLSNFHELLKQTHPLPENFQWQVTIDSRYWV